MTPALAEIGVVHVVYAPYGLPPLQQFLDSYRRHPAGTDHELVLVFKAFAAETLPPDYQAALADLPHRALFVPDGGFDLGSYVLAARACEHRVMCFLNSRSVILADGWLAKLRGALAEPGVGLGGATATNESVTTNLRRLAPRDRNWPRLFARHLRWRWQVWRTGREFPAFPNPHMRTNAFLTERQRWLALQAGPFRSKEDCYRFESGRRGLTRQFLASGAEVRVVGQDGCAYPAARWHESETFRVGEQRNLLVADNQTRDYLAADPEWRRWLTYFAWGD